MNNENICGEKIQKNIKKDLSFIILIFASFIIYFIFWYLIGISNYYNATNDGVYDFGASLQKAYLISHSPIWSKYWIDNFSQGPIIMLFSPLSYIGAQPIWIGILVFGTGFPSFFIYFISKKVLSDIYISFVFAETYLLSVLLIGLNFVDFHFQILFIPFFLGGYCCSIYKKEKTSSILFILSAMVKFEFAIFPLIFSLFILINLYKTNRKNSTKFFDKSITLPIIIFISSLSILLFGYLYNYTYFGMTTNNNSNNYFYIFTYLLLTIFFFLLTFCFFPIFSKKWSPYLLIIIIYSFLLGEASYLYPLIIFFHHTAPWIVFLYLGSIDGIYFLFNKLKLFKNKNLMKKVRRIFIVMMVISTFILVSIYNPISPINKDSNLNFNFSHFQLTPSSEFNEIEELGALIPTNSSVLIQDNMPSLMPRLLPNITSPVIPVAGHTLKNFTSSEIKNDTFHVGQFITTIKYVVADTKSATFNENNTGYPTMYRIVKNFLESKYYGVYAIDGSSFLLKRNFNSSPIIISPFSQKINPQSMSYTGNITDNGMLLIPHYILNTSVATEDSLFLKGNYTASLSIQETNVTSEGQISMVLLPRFGTNALCVKNFTITSGNLINVSLAFVFIISIVGYYWIKIFINNSRGSVILSTMSIDFL
jgi:uncharacterized membrane protein